MQVSCVTTELPRSVRTILWTLYGNELWKTVHLFLHLKKFVSSQRFQNDREAEMSATEWFQSKAADFYVKGIQTLVPRYDKLLNSGGEYVKK